ncbi:MAG TPA: class I SAM-dependent methyltransferase [Gaiellaceae bacterium]|jgi:SAM-dependent methyltransferase|nr:class I SAM-dependent methyltransferase [Gaiellaceae bacterium]
MAEYDAHAADYDVWAADMVEDVQWYVSLAREAAEPIVELAVGTGRVAIPIARDTGKRVIGIDRSPAMLEVARERAAGLPVDLREGDIVDLALDEPVDLVICPFRSLMHVRTWADKRQLFERVTAALRPGGRFAWNVFAFSPFVAVEMEGRRETRGDSWQEVRNVPADNRIDLVRDEGVIPLWWMTRAEQEGLCDVAGLEVEALYGGFHREPYDEQTLEMVWVARKP